MPYETVRYDVAENGVATIALDRPEARNALSDALLDDLLAALAAARDDDAVRCVVLTSTHEKVFSAGGDLGAFAAQEPLVHKHFGSERFVRLFQQIGALGKPTLCAANGHVLAGALGVALACDLIIAKESARFGTPEINVGVFPFMIMALIYRNIGRKKTNELLLLGEQISARRGGADRARQQGRARRRVRRGRGRLGRPAGGQDAAADADGQGRDVPPAGHGVRATRSSTCTRSSRSRSRPRTSRRA